MLLNQLSRALYEIRSTEKTNIYIYIYINKINIYIKKINIYIYIYLSSSAHFPSAGGLGHVPSPSLVSLKVQPPISNPFSTQAIFLFNATKSKVKIKPLVIYQREVIKVIFLFVQRWIIDAVMPCQFQGIQTPRSHFFFKGRG